MYNLHNSKVDKYKYKGDENMLSRLRSTAVLISAFFIFLLGAVAACVVVNATTYHTVRINYLFADGTRAHDPYIATFTDGEPVNVTVTNPTIDGYDPMTLNEGETNPSLLPDNGTQAKTIEVKYYNFNSDVTYTVYYVAGLSHYRARFYLQNIYDDLYTTDQTLNAQYQDLLGITGSFPDNLETVKVPGFTSLFHEPDAIAADGSTVFRLYYDRNYYSVGFDLGEGGYGVEPIYAKYQTEFRVDEPKRVGYTFKGWARTDKDSSVEGVDWHYIDENGEVISEETATADENLLKLEGDLTVPAKDTYYKAVWAPGTTSCSVVYWFENADSDLKNTADEFAGLTEEEIQAKVSKNYSVIAAKDVFNVYEDGHEIPIKPGMVITPDTVIRNKAKKAKDEGIYSGTGDDVIPIKNFFDFNLGYANPNDSRNNDDLAFDENGNRKPEALVYKYDKDGGIIDFNDISQGTSEQLVGNGNYFELNTADNTPIPNYRSDTSVTVRGDGTTRFNVYFRRKEFTLKFFYAREKLSDHTIELTNSTKDYSNKAYTGLNYMQAVSRGTWQAGVADSKPQLNTKYTDPESPDYLPYIFERYEDYSGYRYYYYQVEAKYNAPMKNKWLIDAIQGVDKKGFNGQVCLPGSWAVENATNYYNSHTKVKNYTIKGIYEKLGPELMFASRTADYTELHYLLSWTNSATSSGWNYGMQNVLHFTYQNYVELLPRELEQLEIADYDTSVLAGEGKPYIDVIQFTVNGTAKYYGLPEDNIIETTDSGSQYPINDVSKKTSSVRSDQTPTDLEGFEIENRRLNSNNQIILDTTNTIVDWSDDTTSYRHATIKFFYKRKEYTLKYRNGNRKDESHNRTIMYGAPLNAVYASGEHEGEHRYYWDKPNYFIPELQDHYMFDGWYYTPYYFRQVDVNTATMPAYDMTLYAKWSPKKIDVVFYNNYNEYYEDTNRIELGEDENGDPITEWTVEYGSYVPLNHIPADVHDKGSNRPELTPIADKASFAGWYYIRNRVPRRFEPENLPVTALNAESTGENATLKLFAEWVTQDVAKYKVNYVRADNPDTEVAPPTVGRAYVWKTRTFQAKPGDELSDEYKWTVENEVEGTNWWPTVNSHSIIVKANEEGEEFKPNEYTFTYIQKDNVYYRVQYLDADTRRPINPEGQDIEKITTHASVKEDARVIPGYIADPTSQTLILSASTADTPEEQKAEELRNNVITFLYHKNVTEYVYETEYYTKNLDGEGYSLFNKESLTVPIADEGATTVAVQDLFLRPLAKQIESEGFERAANKVTYTAVDTDGNVSGPVPVVDNGVIIIVDTDKKTIRLYFDRKNYSYSYQYIDQSAAKAYEQANETERVNMWNGVLKDVPNAGTAPVGSTVTLTVPTDYSYTNDGTVTAYTRMTNSDGTLNDVKINIQPAEDGSALNLVKIYYRKDIERDLHYRMICVNNNGETDYDAATGEPLFGRLSVNRQTVESYNQIQDVTFFDTNDEKITVGNQEVDLHLHKYDFLGWYTTPEYDENNPGQNRLTINKDLTKEDLKTAGELPDRDVKYYALVKQEMVQMDVDFFFCDDYTKAEMQTTDEDVFKAYLQQKINDNQLKPDGEYGGKEVIFSNPSKYQNHTQIAWHKNDGFSLSMQNIDNRVYKYEFAGWWEIDEGHLIPKHNWNGGEWSPDSLASQLSRTKNQHLIAVYARRNVTEMPYTLNFNFVSRTGENKTYVKTGTLSGDELNENSENTKITKDGFYALTDEFILSNAPYESNFAQVLNWTDHPDYVIKNSIPGDSAQGTVDRIITDVNAVQSKKNVFATFRTTPDGEYTTISIPYGSNYKQSENMLAIKAAEEYDGKPFAYWEVRKTVNGAVVAKSYKPLFDLCMMDNYRITPVYSESQEEEQLPSITLAHIDDTRNTWTDDKNEVPADGTTDMLYTDFEIAFDDGLQDIYTAPEGTYRTGVVFEQCATLPANKTFDSSKDYKLVSDEANLKAAVLSNSSSYVYDPAKPDKTRNIQVRDIPQSTLTNRDRVQYGKVFQNAYKDVNGTKTYTNGRYLLKVTAYLVKGGQVTLSNSVYVCLAAESEKNLAINCNIGTNG